MANEEQWFYSDGQTQKGPVERHVLELMIAQGQIGAETLIWCNALPAWAPARQVAQFASRFGAATPPPVPAPPPPGTPPPPGLPAAPAAPPSAPPGLPPPRKGLHPLAWVAIGCGALVLLGVVALALVGFFAYRGVKGAVEGVKEAVEAKDDCQAVTETFLREIAAGKYQAAYDNTDPNFRQSTTLQNFTPVARGLQDLGAFQQLNCQEKEVSTNAQYGTVYKRVYVAKYPAKSMKYTFHLRQEGGKLRVLALHYEEEK